MSDSKQIALDFFETAFINRQPDIAAEKYFGPAGYKQHNPDAPDGAEGFVAAISGLFEALPDFSIEVKRVVADDELVAIHAHRHLAPGGNGDAVIDIFRVVDSKIVEHWDVVQRVPDNPANDNTMF